MEKKDDDYDRSLYLVRGLYEIGAISRIKYYSIVGYKQYNHYLRNLK